MRVLFLCYIGGRFYLKLSLSSLGLYYTRAIPYPVLCYTGAIPPIVFIPRGMKMENENNIKPSHLWIFFENPRLLTMIIPIIINDYQANHQNIYRIEIKGDLVSALLLAHNLNSKCYGFRIHRSYRPRTGSG